MPRLISNLRIVSAAALLSAALIAPQSHASLLLEPYLGYDTGSYSVSTVNQNMSGVTYGGRLGFQHLGFMAGLDYMTGNWTDNATPSNTIVPSDLGVFVGFNFPAMFRIYGVYNFQTQDKVSSSSSTADTYKGTGIKLGVGFTGLPFVSINLEYIADTFTKDNSGTLTNNLTDKMYGLTISIPLTFM